MAFTKTIIISIVIVLSAAALVSAADPLYSGADQNKDGKISKQEYFDAVAAQFDRYDKNKDGLLSRDELSQADKMAIQEFIRKYDADHDGKISKDEFVQAAEKNFARFDQNKDGMLSKKEWEKSKKAKDPMFVLFRF